MRTRPWVILCVIGLATSASARSTRLLRTGTTWNGVPIEDLETQCPEVEAVIVDLPANASTPIHLHPVGSYAYVLEGQVTVEEGDLAGGRLVVRRSSTFTKGQAFAEVVNTWHVGTAGAAGVKILVWYLTATGYPNTVTDLDHRVGASPAEGARCSPAKN